jgi:hypothetical protein
MAEGKAGTAGNNMMSQIDKQLEKAEEDLQDMQDSIAEQKKSRKLIEGDKDKGKDKEGASREKEGGGEAMGKAVEFLDGKDKGRDM